MTSLAELEAWVSALAARPVPAKAPPMGSLGNLLGAGAGPSGTDLILSMWRELDQERTELLCSRPRPLELSMGRTARSLHLRYISARLEELEAKLVSSSLPEVAAFVRVVSLLTSRLPNSCTRPVLLLSPRAWKVLSCTPSGREVLALWDVKSVDSAPEDEVRVPYRSFASALRRFGTRSFLSFATALSADSAAHAVPMQDLGPDGTEVYQTLREDGMDRTKALLVAQGLVAL